MRRSCALLQVQIYAGGAQGSEGDMVRYAMPKPEPLRSEHEAFRDAVLGKESSIVTMEQGLRTVRVAESVLSSAIKGMSERIPSDSG